MAAGDIVPRPLGDPDCRDLVELLCLMTAADGTPYLDLLLEGDEEDSGE
ncbi:hypothetical protein AB0D10_05270 [Kitasatospora sp. NPDC048545]